VGINPSNIKIGDFNGDGKQDFAVTNVNSNDVSIRFGNGDGSFYGTSQIEVGEAPVKLVIGDFNEDRIQDIAVASTNSVSILQGIPTTGPTVITRDITVLLDATGTASITPDAINNGANDVCGISLLELDITDFDTSNIGENTVQLTVTDTKGNISIGYAIVTIEAYALGIEENTRDLNILVYPNPTSDIVNIKVPNFNQEPLTYQLYSLQGQLLNQGVLKGSVISIPMDRYEMGIYLLNVLKNNNTMKSFRVVKK
jgi:hypothetical protein